MRHMRIFRLNTFTEKMKFNIIKEKQKNRSVVEGKKEDDMEKLIDKFFDEIVDYEISSAIDLINKTAEIVYEGNPTPKQLKEILKELTEVVLDYGIADPKDIEKAQKLTK